MSHFQTSINKRKNWFFSRAPGEAVHINPEPGTEMFRKFRLANREFTVYAKPPREDDQKYCSRPFEERYGSTLRPTAPEIVVDETIGTHEFQVDLRGLFREAIRHTYEVFSRREKDGQQVLDNERIGIWTTSVRKALTDCSWHKDALQKELDWLTKPTSWNDIAELKPPSRITGWTHWGKYKVAYDDAKYWANQARDLIPEQEEIRLDMLECRRDLASMENISKEADKMLKRADDVADRLAQAAENI